jgi:transcriptional regulator with XRE-family HTH domain
MQIYIYMEDIYKHIGQVVKKRRIEMGLTQEELAEKTDLHPSYIGQIERGVKKISLLTLNKLSNGLNLNLYQFFKQNDEKSIIKKPDKPDIDKKIINLIKTIKQNDKKKIIYKIIRELIKLSYL